MDINEKDDCLIISCGRSIELSTVPLCKSILQKALEANKKILLQAGDIERIDTAGIQLFLSFWLTAQQYGISCQWESVSSIFSYIAKLEGIFNLLEIPYKK